MPASYFADFTAYVDARKRPENFPREVHVHETYGDVENIDHLKAIVNDRFIKMVSSAGLVVLKDPFDILDVSRVTFDKRRFVPWHMLTHMEVKVTLIAEPASPQEPLLPIHLAPEPKAKEKVN